jgi:hypothetical protein
MLHGTPQTISHRFLLICLVISLAIHLVAWLQYQLTSKAGPTAATPLTVVLRTAPQTVAPKVPETNLPPISETPTPTLPPADVSTIITSASRLALPRRVDKKPLDLSLPPFEDEAELSPGSIVVDPRLREQLITWSLRNTTRAAVPGFSALDTNQSQQGGRWATLVQLGNKCFRILEANPLEPFSQEQWFAIDCTTTRQKIGR